MQLIRSKIVLLIVLSSISSLSAQTDSSIVSVSLSGYKTSQKQPRSVMSVRNNEGKVRLNPLYFFASSAMFMYQRVFSEQISADCQYAISCSEYTKKSIELHGVFKGTLIGLHQLHHCTSLTSDEYLSHRINSHGKIINPVE